MRIHVVAPGDTLAGIARRYGVSVARLMADNGIAPDQTLAVGQALIVTLAEEIYEVERGDTLTSISRSLGVTPLTLIQNNPTLTRDPVLRPGQNLTVSFQGEKIRELTLLGFVYPYVDLTVLRSALPFLTYLAVFSYGFRADGTLIVPRDQRLLTEAFRFGTAPVLVLTAITEDGGFSSEKVSAFLRDPALQETVLENLMAVMAEKGYVGMDVDFEYIPGEDAENFLSFLRRASAILGENGFFLSVDLAPKTGGDQVGLLYEAHNYPAIGAIADVLHIMTYEWGYTYGPPMAVAPLDAVRRVLTYGVSVIPPEKILMGIPNYGYDWTLPYERGVTAAENIGNQTAVARAGAYRAEILFSDRAQSPYFRYTRNGRSHEVWFEDVRSIQAKFDLCDELGLRGAFYWNLMRPFRQNWAFISTRYTVEKRLPLRLD